MAHHEEQPQRGALLATIAMLAALVEAVAGVELALAPLSALATAAAAPRTAYIAAVLAGAGALTLVWLLRDRPRVAIPILLGWPLPTYYLLRPGLTNLGSALHGETIAHYFAGFLAAGSSAYVLSKWVQRANWGRWRVAIVTIGALGLLGLLVAHASEARPEMARWSQRSHLVGAALFLVTWPAALTMAWRSMSRSPSRWLAAVLLIPWTTRIALVGPSGLVGEIVPAQRTIWLGSTIVISAIALGFVYRPRVPVWVRITLAIVVAWFCLWLRGQYDRRFGQLESSLSGLLESFFGFTVPYPAYVADWQVSLMTVGVFFILITIATALVSSRDRKTGVALTLMTLGGLGLGSPHLALLVGTGAILLVDSGLDPDNPRPSRPRQPITPAAAQLATELGLDAPIVLDAESVVAVEGSVDGCPVRWRARPRGDLWEIQLSVGVIPRDRPKVRLLPNGAETTTSDATAHHHRVRGAIRALEPFGDALPEAIARFPAAEAAFYPAGAQLRIRAARSETIDANAFAQFIRVVATAMAKL
ncbi:MAG: hypothetical protein B7733_18055 [Myxococcales bacterium FL481]|nr:MAG: hypothetical protein B7733_18055 [Myxococcales bacterium FL481]